MSFKALKFDRYLSPRPEIHTSSSFNSYENVSFNKLRSVPSNSFSGQSSTSTASSIAFTALSTVSTLALIYWMGKDLKQSGNKNEGRSTPLPGYGILGDKVNEFIELFLDALTVYVHNDNKWECQQRMLCEANQRAIDYGTFYSVVMYFLSLAVSMCLHDQRVSESLEAMKFGRKGNDCRNLYPKCPFSL